MKEFDLDKNGVITTEEIDKTIRIQEHQYKVAVLKDQSKLAYISLLGMVLYPILMAGSSAFGFSEAATLLSEITGVYFGSIAVIVAAFFGSEAYAMKEKP